MTHEPSKRLLSPLRLAGTTLTFSTLGAWLSILSEITLHSPPPRTHTHTHTHTHTSGSLGLPALSCDQTPVAGSDPEPSATCKQLRAQWRRFQKRVDEGTQEGSEQVRRPNGRGVHRTREGQCPQATPPLQYSCLGNSMDKGAWHARQSVGSESDRTERLLHLERALPVGVGLP